MKTKELDKETLFLLHYNIHEPSYEKGRAEREKEILEMIDKMQNETIRLHSDKRGDLDELKSKINSRQGDSAKSPFETADARKGGEKK